MKARGGVSRSVLVVVSGLPATGKTTLATGLAERIGAAAFSRDEARQGVEGRLVMLDRLFTRLTGRYRRGLQEEAIRRLEIAVADGLGRGRPVVVEIVADRSIRRRFENLAADHEAPIYSIELICSDPAEFARRLRARSGNWQRNVARMSESYEPAPGALVVDSRFAPREMVDQAVSYSGSDNCLTVARTASHSTMAYWRRQVMRYRQKRPR